MVTSMESAHETSTPHNGSAIEQVVDFDSMKYLEHLEDDDPHSKDLDDEEPVYYHPHYYYRYGPKFPPAFPSYPPVPQSGPYWYPPPQFYPYHHPGYAPVPPQYLQKDIAQDTAHPAADTDEEESWSNMDYDNTIKKEKDFDKPKTSQRRNEISSPDQKSSNGKEKRAHSDRDLHRLSEQRRRANQVQALLDLKECLGISQRSTLSATLKHACTTIRELNIQSQNIQAEMRELFRIQENLMKRSQ
eukprot:m.54540 g.54540  ORF g.54540 m.54540 type:complete len:245 (+) comp10933_c0_seq4:169-903(+)